MIDIDYYRQVAENSNCRCLRIEMSDLIDEVEKIMDRGQIGGRKVPKKVLRCVTHHSCDCRQWKYEEMEKALQKIRTWAVVTARPEHRVNAVNTLIAIAEKAAEVLGCLDKRG